MEPSKKCPECAEMVQADAKVCRYCGHRFDSALHAPSALGWPRVAGLIVYVILAMPPLVSVSSQPSEATKWLSAAIIAALVLAIVGTINWAVAARRRGRSWPHATLSLGPLAISFFVVILGAMGQTSSA